MTLISVEAALNLLLDHRPAPTSDICALQYAGGRRLAADIHAKVNRPPADVSAMDGYAVRLSDVAAAGATLKVIGEAPAGTPLNIEIGPGEAARIFTGGHLPKGADHIIMQEHADRNGDDVSFTRAYDTPAFIRRTGLDFSTGDELLKASTHLGPAHISLLAAANHASVDVFAQPRVGILANGNELRAPGSDLERGQIINSNPAGLMGLTRDWGGAATDLGIAGDRTASIRDHIRAAGDIDIFVPVGGASVGDHDHMRRAFREEGFEFVFEKVAVRPGKPTWFAIRGDQCVLGLPGNPASALVCAHLFLKPLLGAANGLETIPATAAITLEANGPREHFMRARAEWTPTGALAVTPLDNQDSSLLRPFVDGNCLIHRPANAPPMAPDDITAIMPLQPLH